jgi:thioredoxin-related protein
MKKIVTAVSMAVFLLVSGCASSKPAWLSNYDEAKQLAEKNNKKIFLLFSADETDEESTALRKNVFDAKKFHQALKEYVLVNLDFSESRYTAADVAEDADEETQAVAEVAQNLLIADSEVAQKYSVQGLPTAYLLTKEGYVLAAIEITPEITTVEQVIALVDGKKDQIDTITALLSRIDSSSATEKALAINDLFEATEIQFRDMFFELFVQIPELDPDNTTGFLAKFTFQIAYHNIMDYLSVGDIGSIIMEFYTLAENPILTPDEKQEALFSGAAFMAQSGYGDFETVLDFLADALEASPESEIAPYIVESIEQIKTLQAAGAEGE